MKRHVDSPNLSVPSLRQRGSGQPIMELVNGTFGVFAASLPCFWQRLASIGRRKWEFQGTTRP
jgi:hypothetical protein